jgi:hypothetical protein
MFTHLARACERTCARACVINSSFIYGRFLFKFAVNILHITTSSKRYVLFMFTNRGHACERARPSACVIKTYTYRLTDSLQICWAHTTNSHTLHGLHTYMLLFKFAVSILHITTSSKGYVLFMFTQPHTCERVRG